MPLICIDKDDNGSLYFYTHSNIGNQFEDVFTVSDEEYKTLETMQKLRDELSNAIDDRLYEITEDKDRFFMTPFTHLEDAKAQVNHEREMTTDPGARVKHMHALGFLVNTINRLQGSQYASNKRAYTYPFDDPDKKECWSERQPTCDPRCPTCKSPQVDVEADGTIIACRFCGWKIYNQVGKTFDESDIETRVE